MALSTWLTTLLETEPRTVGALEALTGPLPKVMWMGASMPIPLPSSPAPPAWPADVALLWIDLGLQSREVDIYHHDPLVELGPSAAVAAYQAFVHAPPEEVRAVLDRVGVRGFLLGSSGEGRCALGWHRDAVTPLPGFAPPGFLHGEIGPPRPPPPPPAPARLRHSPVSRSAFLRRCVDALSHATTPADCDALLARIPTNAGVSRSHASRSHGGVSVEIYGLKIDPPEPATVVAALLGLQRPHGFTRDVHMSAYHLADGDEADGVVWPRYPSVGRFKVDALLNPDHAPELCVQTPVATAGFRVAGSTATVSSLRFDPPW